MWYSEGKLDRDHDYEEACERDELVEYITEHIKLDMNTQQVMDVLFGSDIPDEVVEFVYRVAALHMQDSNEEIRTLAQAALQWVDIEVYDYARTKAEHIVDSGKAKHWLRERAE